MACTGLVATVLSGCGLGGAPPGGPAEDASSSGGRSEGDAGEAGPARAATPEQAVSAFRVAFTVDITGEVEPCGCAVEPLGGLARQATVLARSREEHRNTIYLDAGDLEGPSSAKRAEAVRAALARMGLGGRLADTHDLTRLASRTPPPPSWPLVLSNVRAAGKGRRRAGRSVSLPRTLLLNVGEIRVGVLGLRRPDRATIAAARRLDLAFEDPSTVVSTLAAELQSQGAAVVVALVDVGPLGAVRALLRQSKGVDFAIAAGVDNRLEPAELVAPGADPSHPVVLLSPMARGREVGLLDVYLAHPGGAFVDAQARPRLAARLSDHEHQAAALERGGVPLPPERLRHLRGSLERAIADERRALADPYPTEDANTYEEQLVPLDERWPDDPEVAALVAPHRRQRPAPPRPRYSRAP